MRRLLFLLFIIVPLIEIVLFILLGQTIGILPTLLGVLATALLGAVLVRAQGRSLIAEIQATIGRGELPARALADAMMVGMAGVLLLTPGYFTDLMGVLLLIPAVRSLIYRQLAARLAIQPAPRRPPGPRTIDLEGESWRSR